MLIMPNTPSKIRMCSQQEIDWIKWNYESDMKSEDNAAEVTAKQGFMMAVLDPKTWMLCGILYATYTAGAVNNFFPTVVAGLGFDRTTSYGLTAVSALRTTRLVGQDTDMTTASIHCLCRLYVNQRLALGQGKKSLPWIINSSQLTIPPDPRTIPSHCLSSGDHHHCQCYCRRYHQHCRSL